MATPTLIVQPSTAVPQFLRGGGEMGALIRGHDWSKTTLGAPGTWPKPLCTAIGLLLNAAQPMYVWWGPTLLCFYNDAYRQSIGPERHPGSLGRGGREVWQEIWDIIGPQIQQVMSGGGGISHENALVPITRNGRHEDVYWTYSYNPIFDPSAPGGIGGVLVVCAETTQTVLANRRATEQQRRFAELFDQAPLFMTMLRGPEHRYEFANPAYLRLVGQRDIIGRTVAEVIPETVPQGFMALLDEVFRHGEPFLATGKKFELHSESGSEVIARYLDFVYQPIRDVAGVVSGIFVVGVDVSDRALIDTAFRENEEQLRLATEAAEIGLWDVNIVTDTLYWPARVKGMFGISADVPISMKDFYAGLHPDDKDTTTRAFLSAVDPAQRALYDVEYRTVGKEDGIIRWVAAKGRGVFEDDACVRVLGTAIDITSRKAAEQQLHELNETLERRVAEALAARKVFVDIIEATDAFIQVLDLSYRFMAINRASADEFERAYGVRPKVGDNLLDLLEHRPDQRHALRAVWSRALEGEEFTALDDDGECGEDRRYYEMKFNSLRDRDGNRVGAFQFVHDVTKRLRDQVRLAEAERHLRQTQKIDAIGQLTGGVAHDFNNLLMVISGGLSLIERPGAPDRRQRIITQMRRAAERGASLSRQLLAFSRRQPLNPEPVDLGRQIDGMRELLDRTLRGDVHVKTDLAKGLWPIQVDPAELELVVLNLCVNARDAMPTGGVITLSARNVPGLCMDNLSGDFVQIAVADTGTGMSAEVLSHIFEPFFTTKEIGKGSGLGLPQVYGFAQQSGGSVSVSSLMGEGTTVVLLLPRSQAEPVAASSDTSAKMTTRRAMPAGSILLVEDDDEVAQLVTDMFRELGYRVTRVASAQAALGALADDPLINLVFSDVMMPGTMNGLDLAREIGRRRPTMPVLLTSGYAGPNYKTGETSSMAILPKPYELHDLDSAVRAALGSSNAEL